MKISLIFRDDAKLEHIIKLPSTKEGNKTRIFTLGSRGRDFLQREIGLPVTWHFEPEKVRHISYNQIEHALLLTRFLIVAQKWGKANSLPVGQIRISYELGKG